MKTRTAQFVFPFFLAGLAFVLPTGASATVMDFEALEHVDSGQSPVPGSGKFYAEKGYEFTSSAPIHNFATWGTLSANYLGSTALWNGDGTGVTGITTLARADGQAFDLLSIDVGELNVSGPGIAGVTFEGVLSGGGTVTQSFTTDGVRSTGSGFQTFTLVGFTDVLSVSWLQATPFIQFDNVTTASDADAVPEPAALGLLGLGLAGLGFVRRRGRG